MARRMLALGAVAAAAALLGPTTPVAAAKESAHAQARWQCSPGAFCIYWGTNGTGARLELRHGVRDLANVAGGKLNDHVLSARNRTGRNWCLYEHGSRWNKGQKHIITSGFQNNVGSFGYKVSQVQPC
ncbi:peptidase inhibitor family I36 protein [Thermopolyspora flexuosa]|nr:peptidase inhibitor family I36 protein [Thermopolyspora flexuosa]